MARRQTQYRVACNTVEGDRRSRWYLDLDQVTVLASIARESPVVLDAYVERRQVTFDEPERMDFDADS